MDSSQSRRAASNRAIHRGRRYSRVNVTDNSTNTPKQQRSSQNHTAHGPRYTRTTLEKRNRSTSRSNQYSENNEPSKRRKLGNDDDNQNTTGSLCRHCSAIDWAQLDYWMKFDGIITWRGKPVYAVGKRFRDVAADSKCPLCRQLRAPWIEPFLKDQGLSHFKNANIGDEIHVFRNLRHMPHVNDFPTSLLVLRKFNAPFHIAVVPSCGGWKAELRSHVAENGMVAVFPTDSPLKAEVFVPKQVPKMFSPSIITPWMRQCHGHKTLCTPRSPEVDGMRVIDCRPDRPSIRDYWPGCKYVALSYVWGPETNSHAAEVTVRVKSADAEGKPHPDNFLPILQPVSHNIQQKHMLTTAKETCPTGNAIALRSDSYETFPFCKTLPMDLPRTIRDAIKVTRDLGYNYLWVDKYCIDQSNEEEKQRQCSQMGNIYSGAQITIFALGRDVHAGLPGVNRPRRHWQQQYTTIGHHTFVYTLPDPHHVIKRSRWSTRAWTYQEGLFSTRRLFFTNHQLYYECNAMNSSESFASNMQHLHILSGQRFRAFNRAGKFICGNSNQFSHYDIKRNTTNHRKVDIIQRCHHQTRQYTKRVLTQKEDVLSAFSGIADFYARTGAQIYNLAGISIPHPMARIHMEAEYLDHLSFALAWTHRARRGISFDISKPRVRNGFPSWSWAGWEGEIGKRVDHPFCWTSLLSSVQIEFQDGSIEDYSWLHGRKPDKHYLRLRLSTARRLHFDAHVIDPAKVEFWDKDPCHPSRFVPSYKVHLHMSKGPADLIELHAKLLVGRYQLVVLGKHGKPRDAIFRAIQLADKKSRKARNRRIELLRYKEPEALVCLVLYTVRGVSYRAGLAKFEIEDTDAAWRELGEKQRFTLV